MVIALIKSFLIYIIYKYVCFIRMYLLHQSWYFYSQRYPIILRIDRHYRNITTEIPNVIYCPIKHDIYIFHISEKRILNYLCFILKNLCSNKLFLFVRLKWVVKCPIKCGGKLISCNLSDSDFTQIINSLLSETILLPIRLILMQDVNWQT